MSISELSAHTLYVQLPSEPDSGDELNNVQAVVSEKNDKSVIIDFSAVDLFVSASMEKLLQLRTLLGRNGNGLVLCNVAAMTKAAFVVAYYDGIFVFADDKRAAMVILCGEDEELYDYLED